MNHEVPVGLLRHEDSVMNILHLNIRSLENKVEEFELFVDTLSARIDVLCLTETWFRQGQECATIINGFMLAANYSRSSKRGGGVSVFVRESEFIKYKTRAEESVEGVFEVCVLDVLAPATSTIVTVYRAPDPSNLNDFFCRMDELLERLSSGGRRVIVCGDWNVNILDKKQETRVNEMAGPLGFDILDYSVTRLTATSKTALDFVIANCKEIVFKENIDPGLSDHSAQIFAIPFNSNKLEGQSKLVSKHLRRFNNTESFIEDLKKTSWESVYEEGDTNTKFGSFLNIFLRIFELHFPKKTNHTEKSTTGIYKGWISEEIKADCRKKRELYLHIKAGAPSNCLVEYNNVKRALRLRISKAKKEYHAKIIQKSTNKQAATWKIVRSLSRSSTIKKAEQITLKVGDNLITDPEKVATTFNTFYATIAESVVDYTHDTTDDCLKKLKAMTSGAITDFNFSHVHPHEVFKVIQLLKPSLSSGWDDVPMTVLKACSKWIATPLAHIFNSSFETGVFPDRMKYATLRPIHKKGDKNVASNYRPVSVLIGFSKVHEKLALVRFQNHLDWNNILCEQQHGFRKGRSPMTAIFQLVNGVGQALDEKRKVGTIFCDLSKAFDTLDHSLLLKKLAFYGVNDVSFDWFMSYLTNRKQRVQLSDAAVSKWETVKHGVPQGSILGPVLFILYVNDLARTLADQGIVVQFADDTSVVIEASNTQELEIKMRKALKELGGWFTPNKMALNLGKTVSVGFSARGSQVLPGVPVEVADHSKFLGLTVDSQLKWHLHVANISKKLASTCFALRSLGRQCNIETLRTVYFAQFQSLVQYGVVFWGGTSASLPVCILQKRAIRYMLSLRRADSCRKAFKDLRILTISGLYILSIAMFVFDNIDLFKQRNQVHGHFTRGEAKLHIKRHRLAVMDHDLLSQGSKVINKLPSEIVGMSNRSIFKQSLKSFLIDKVLYTTEEFFNM